MRVHFQRIVLIVGLLALLALLPLALSEYYIGLVTQMMIYALFAMSLDILLGYTGLPSLGHAAFFGVASYTVGILSVKVTQNFGVVIASAAGVTIAVSAVFGLLAIRTSGAYFFMITLALAQVLWGVAFKWRTLTGGDDGLPGVPRPSLGTFLSLGSTTNFYLFVLVLTVVVAAILYLFMRSPFGLALKGIRESETRMCALGYNVWLHKYLAFIISGSFAGLAGILFAYYNGFVSPSHLSLVISAKVLLMVILGGAGTLFGPALGAGLIVLLENLVSAHSQRWLFILGSIYVAVALFAPQGISDAFKAKVGRSASL